MNKKWQILVAVLGVGLFAILYYYFIIAANTETTILSPPSKQNWFGTDLSGNDVFLRTMQATGFELLSLLMILAFAWFSGLVLGSLATFLQNKFTRELIMNLIHYIATLPILLVALFFLIIFGAGYFNSVIILSLAIMPTQSLFVYNQMETAKSEDFLIAKKSYGFTDLAILKLHILPYISKRYKHYTLSRSPEIIMMNLALGFLGLGLQEPNASLGRMLFDGLSFMYSAWWLWGFVVIMIILIYFVLRKLI